MAWGAWDKSGDNWFRVGTATSISGNRVTIQYKIESRYNPVSDDQTMNLDGKYSGGQIINFYNGGGTITVATRSWTGSYGSTYTIGCHAYGIYNGATPSHSERITIPARPPSRVSRPTVSSINTKGAVAHWNAPNNGGARIDRYQVSWSQSSSGTGRIYSFGGGIRSQNNRENWANTTYYIKVRAHNSAGWGGWSPPRSVRTKAEAPNAPTWGSTIRGTSGRMNIEWSNNPTNERPISRNRIQWWSSVDSNWSHAATVSAGTTSWRSSVASHNRVYRYRVRAEGPGGNSAWVTGGTVATQPAEASGLTAKKINNGNDIRVTWTDNAAPTQRTRSFIVQDNPDGTGWVQVGQVGGNATQFVHESPDPAKTHRYRVKTNIYSQGELYSGWSSLSNTVQLQAPPKAPSRVGPTGVLDRDEPVTLEFKHETVDTSDQTEAELRWRYQGDAWTDVHLDGQDSTVDIGVPGRTGTIEWQARTRGDYPEFGPWSPTWAFETVSRPIAVISEPDTPLLAQSVLHLKWTYFNEDEAGQTRWEAQVFQLNEGYAVDQGTGDSAQTEYTFEKTLEDQTDYEIRLRVYSASGLWSEWATFEFTTNFPLPVEVRPEPVWDRSNASVSLSFFEPTATMYEWTGEPHQSTSIRTEEEVTYTNLITNPRGKDTNGTVTVRENLVPNPNFEYGIDQWRTFGDADLSPESENPIEGEQSLYWMYTNAGVNNWAYAVASGEIGATANRLYLYLKVRPEFDGRMTFNLGSDFENSTRHERNVQAGVEQALTMEYDATGVTTWYVGVGQSTETLQEGSAAIIDQVMVSTLPITEYGDGDSASIDSDLTWEWSETPGASPSTVQAPKPVGWEGAYYSKQKNALATIPGQTAVFTLPEDPGLSTLVILDRENGQTSHEQFTGTEVSTTTNYFRVAVIDETETYSDEWFDGALESRVPAEWIDVQRVMSNGEIRTIATNLPPDTSMTDPLPILRGPTCYRVISHTSLPTSLVGGEQCVFAYDGSRPCPPLEQEWPEQYGRINGDPEPWMEVIINQGEGFDSRVIGGFDLQINDPAIGRKERALVQYFGRAYPEEHTGEAKEWETNLSVSIPVSRVEAENLGVSPYEDWAKLADSPAPFWYRDYQGRYHQVSLSEPSVGESEYGWRKLDLKLTRVNEVEVIFEEGEE